MEFKEKMIKNLFTRFGLISSEKEWHQVHVSGHGDGEQIKKVIDGAKAKKLIPIHTEHEEHFDSLHHNVQKVTLNGSLTI